MKKSSLKTFLAGQNEFGKIRLRGAQLLSRVVEKEKDTSSQTNQYFYGAPTWYVDVLDDGTAITYTAAK